MYAEMPLFNLRICEGLLNFFRGLTIFQSLSASNVDITQPLPLSKVSQAAALKSDP